MHRNLDIENFETKWKYLDVHVIADNVCGTKML